MTRITDARAAELLESVGRWDTPWRDLLADRTDLLARIAELEAALHRARRDHNGSGFTGLSCNLGDESLAGRGCNCGAEEHNDAIDAVLGVGERQG